MQNQVWIIRLRSSPATVKPVSPPVFCRNSASDRNGGYLELRKSVSESPVICGGFFILVTKGAVMREKLILVTGGARSGKSEFAEKFMRAYTKQTAYIATAEILDEEMRDRVSMHKLRRLDDFWLNFEAPYDADKLLIALPTESEGILFDCLTLYVSNMLYGNYQETSFVEKIKTVKENIQLLVQAARESKKTVLFVTNEVGLGIVPDNELAREYRDIVGWVNQWLAQQCDHVFFTVCGQAVDIKQLAFKLPQVED